VIAPHRTRNLYEFPVNRTTQSSQFRHFLTGEPLGMRVKPTLGSNLTLTRVAPGWMKNGRGAALASLGVVGESRMVPRAVRCPSCRRSVPGDVLAAVGDACPHCQRPLDPSAKHERAVAQTLDWADQAAGRGKYADALAWLKMVEAIGDRLSDAYEEKQRHWRAALTSQSGRSQRECA